MVIRLPIALFGCHSVHRGSSPVVWFHEQHKRELQCAPVSPFCYVSSLYDCMRALPVLPQTSSKYARLAEHVLHLLAQRASSYWDSHCQLRVQVQPCCLQASCVRPRERVSRNLQHQAWRSCRLMARPTRSSSLFHLARSSPSRL